MSEIAKSSLSHSDREQDEQESETEKNPAVLGCLATFGSVLVTCVLLYLNATIVMAMVSFLNSLLPVPLRKPQTMQFLLFLLPVLMVVAQWMMIDFARSRLHR